MIGAPKIIKHAAGTCRQKKIFVSITSGTKTIAIHFGGSAYDDATSVDVLFDDVTKRGCATVRLMPDEARMIGQALVATADQKELESDI